MDPSFLNRNVNEGFSGGEKKRNEILQLAVLDPEVAILDEIDSGLDVDALRDVSSAVNGLRYAEAFFFHCSTSVNGLWQAHRMLQCISANTLSTMLLFALTTSVTVAS